MCKTLNRPQNQLLRHLQGVTDQRNKSYDEQINKALKLRHQHTEVSTQDIDAQASTAHTLHCFLSLQAV